MSSSTCVQMEGAPLPVVRIVQHELKGKVLVATQACHAGQEVLREQPVMLVPPGAEKALALYRHFLRQPPAVQDKVLGFHSPVDGPRAVTVRGLAPTLGIPKEEVEGFVRVFTAVEFSAVAVKPAPECGEAGESPSLGLALYEVACRASHSCQPNCFWYSDGQARRVVRTLVDVAAGEELTIDYESELMSLEPVDQRRAKLQAAKEFLCCCPRCSAPVDDTRCFPCNSSACDGHHAVQLLPASRGPSPDSRPDPDQATLAACSSCGAVAAASYTAGMLEKESTLVQELAEINEVIDSGRAEVVDVEVAARIRRLRAPHPHHHLAADAAQLRWELARCRGEWAAAAEACRQAIGCRAAIVRIPSRTTAFWFEYLGDALVAQGQGGKPGTAAPLLLQALAAYRAAVRGLMVTLGPEHAWAACAARKLAAAQALVQPAGGAQVEAEAEAEACRLCGEARLDGQAALRCGGCGQARYCCKPHQRAHWPVHRSSCKGKPRGEGMRPCRVQGAGPAEVRGKQQL